MPAARAHASSVRVTQETSVQHAPTGSEHDCAVHDDPPTLVPPFATQSSGSNTAQEPSKKQHACGRPTQTIVWQVWFRVIVPPAPMQVDVSALMHVPSGKQQAPIDATPQELGVHIPGTALPPLAVQSLGKSVAHELLGKQQA